MHLAVDGVGVAARARVCLDDRDAVGARQEPGGGKTGNARSDDGDMT